MQLVASPLSLANVALATRYEWQEEDLDNTARWVLTRLSEDREFLRSSGRRHKYLQDLGSQRWLKPHNSSTFSPLNTLGDGLQYSTRTPTLGSNVNSAKCSRAPATTRLLRLGTRNVRESFRRHWRDISSLLTSNIFENGCVTRPKTGHRSVCCAVELWSVSPFGHLSFTIQAHDR